MDDFFAVWEAAKDIFGLSRLVHVDLEEAYIKIYQDERMIIKVEGTHEELEHVYQLAALRLNNWVKRETA